MNAVPDPTVATAVVDTAFAKALDGYFAANAITEAAAAHKLSKDSPTGPSRTAGR
jgi:hypothetical protein